MARVITFGSRCEGARKGALAAVLSVVLASLAFAAAEDPRITVTPRGEVYEVRGEFSVPVANHIAWHVLSDYEHIPSFVSSMKSSVVQSREGSRLRLRQRATAGAFLVRRTVEVDLEVTEEPGRRIAFHDVDGRDFRLYSGAWTIAPSPSGSVVSYVLVARPRAALPGFVGRNVMGSSARRLLEEVRDEMMRRSMLAGTPADSAR